MEERMVRIEELAMILDINVLTIERWYRFKRQNPDNEIISLLPDYILRPNSKNRSVRFWRISDIDRFKEFQNSIVKGTKGFMGSVTNPKNPNYKKEALKNGKKKSKRSSRKS